MIPEETRKTARLLLALRDALFASESWENVPDELRKRNTNLDEIRRRLKPRIEFDPHNHTVHSDGQFTYRQLLWWCKAVGIKAVGVTDHDNIHPSIGDAIEEAHGLGLRLVPGLEITVHRLGGQAWKGLEVGLHFFPAGGFADYIRSADGAEFLRRFKETTRLKTEQGYGALDLVNRRFLRLRDLPEISRDELWEVSGGADPVSPATLTLLILKRLFESNRPELLREFPNTRVIYTHLQAHGLIPPSQAPPQTFDDIVDIRKTLSRHGIRSTITMNHPEEWLSKCGLTRAGGAPDPPAILRLALLMLLHSPRLAPVSFIELYTSRNTPASRKTFQSLFDELTAIRKQYLPQLAPLHPIASTDSHRVTGFLDAAGEPQGWVPGEDFIFGLGSVDRDHPAGNLEVPADYPSAEEILSLMENAAT